MAKTTKKYSDNKKVIYEICNAPSSGGFWLKIKKYAGKVINQIRKYDSKAVILAGPPN